MPRHAVSPEYHNTTGLNVGRQSLRSVGLHLIIFRGNARVKCRKSNATTFNGIRLERRTDSKTLETDDGNPKQ